MTYFITGSLVALTEVTLKEVTPEYVSWLNDPTVTKYLESGRLPTRLEDLEAYVKGINRNNTLFLAIYRMETNQHIGNIKLGSIDWISRTANLGIMIGDKECWGKGYGAESITLLLGHAFETLNLRKVYLGVCADHAAAIRLYERLGFLRDGVMKSHVYMDGGYRDRIWMSVFNEN